MNNKYYDLYYTGIKKRNEKNDIEERDKIDISGFFKLRKLRPQICHFKLLILYK